MDSAVAGRMLMGTKLAPLLPCRISRGAQGPWTGATALRMSTGCYVQGVIGHQGTH